MTSEQVFELSVIKNNFPSACSTQPDDQLSRRYVSSGFTPFSILLFSFLAHGAHLLFPPSYEPEVSDYDALDSHSHKVTTTDNMEMSKSVVYEDWSLEPHQETNLACVLGHRAARRTQNPNVSHWYNYYSIFSSRVL